MRIEELIANESILRRIGEIVLTGTDWRIKDRNHVIPFTEEQWEKWSRIHASEPLDPDGTDWEIADKDADRYYNVRSYATEVEGERSIIHLIYDVTEYAQMFRELSMYSNEWRRMSSCQSELIGHLSDDPCGCLPIAIRYFDADRAVLYITRRGVTVRYILESRGDGSVIPSVIPDAEHTDAGGTRSIRPDLDGAALLCCCTGQTVSGHVYGLYIDCPASEGDIRGEMLYNEFKLYIENALLREQIVYENEHDALTGLYNRAKYAELTKLAFPFWDSITVLNLDVNYLKRTNDTYGHDMGNRLLLKSGESIKAVVGENIYGFRVGGDEFLIIAKDLTGEEADKLRSDWQHELDGLNAAEPVPECVIACGKAYAKAPYDLKTVLDEADRLMYEDKRAIKIARGDDPDAR